MSDETVNTLVVGGGQAGLAMSEHLSKHGIDHLVLERHRIAERWRSARWDSLVANGPAWHDRFPSLEISDVGPDDFASKHSMAAYFEEFADKMDVPIRCGVEVTSVEKAPDGSAFVAQTSQGTIRASNVVAATGPFQNPAIPPLVPAQAGLVQMHSTAYRNPAQLDAGGVLVVGGGIVGVANRRRIAGCRARCLPVSWPARSPAAQLSGARFCLVVGRVGQMGEEIAARRG